MEKDVEGSVEFLSQYLTERRKALIDTVLDQRTRYLTVVLEDVFKPQNASAVLRTCECMGLQDVYIIENSHRYEVNPDVVKGASKWISINHYAKTDHSNTPACFADLREKGFRIAAADPRGEVSIEELDLEQPTALVFGTEYAGLSNDASQDSDLLVTIPMHGFTESYNLSVSVAICLQSLTTRLRERTVPWGLSHEEKLHLKLDWYKDHVRDADGMLKRMNDQ